MPQKKEKKGFAKWIIAILIIMLLGFFSILAAGVIGLLLSIDSTDFNGGNVAKIEIDGIITTDAAESYFITGLSSSTNIVDLIQKADENPEIEAILFEINSPGGSAVASEEIASEIKKTNKTTVAWIREVGASGGYWVASACDYIVASPVSVTGSIGVISSYLEFSGFLEKYNVTYQRLVAGEYKDMGSPYKGMSRQEKILFQQKLDRIHDYFIQNVAENRGMSEEGLKEFADGQIFLGSEAFENGLIDVLGSKDEAVAIIESELNITAEIVNYEKPKTLMEILTEASASQFYRLGQGLGSSLLQENSLVRT